MSVLARRAAEALRRLGGRGGGVYVEEGDYLVFRLRNGSAVRVARVLAVDELTVTVQDEHGRVRVLRKADILP